MTSHTLPRPSRPSIAPPTGPLPSLPVAKTRVSNTAPAAAARSSPGSLLPARPNHNNNNNYNAAAASRAVSSPQRPVLPKGHTNSASNLPTLTTTESPGGPLPPGKSLRKTVSIGAFPQPPKHASRLGSHPPSPLSASSTPNGESVDSRIAPGFKPPVTPARKTSLKKTTPRSVSNVGGRSLLGKSPLSPPSLLNGSGESLAVENGGHLSLPSPPQSRNSSAQGSYATSVTTFEDVGDDDVRSHTGGSAMAADSAAPKDGKGNVIVSVRVRPDVATKDAKPEGEWEVSGKKALIAYRGREGGDYYYGRSHNVDA